MAESDYVTIEGAAQRCGVNPKTIQRAIRKGRLPARYPQPNRCEIAIADLERFHPASGHLPGQSAEDLVSRVAALEQRVADLEEQVHDLQASPSIVKTGRRSSAREHLTGPLPRKYVSLLAFARLHNIAEATVLTHVDMGLLPAKQGAWTDADSTLVTLALDRSGKAVFFQIYCERPIFLACNHCPHGYLDMSRQRKSE
jgi:hypothetical protein